MKKICLFTFIVLFLAFTAMSQEKISKSFDGVDEISMNLASGDCTFKKGSSSTIEVVVQYTFDTDEFIPEFEQRGSRLIIKEKFEKGSHSGWSKWTITIPDGLEVDVNSGSGDLIAANLKLDLKSNSGSGDIDLTKTSGDVKINTGSGDVEIDTQEGNLSVNTGSGNIQMTNGSGDIDINAGSGDIRIGDSKGDFSINTGSGSINAMGITLTGKSSFNTGSGDAEIMLESSLDYDISVNSGSGDAVLDFNNNAINGMVEMKANKKNGRIEAPFDFDKVEEKEQGNQTIVIKTAKIGSKDIKINVTTGSGKAEIMK